jgi:AraC-like DNA-binding protein
MPEELRHAESFQVVVVRLDGYRRLLEAVDSQTIRSMLTSIAGVAIESFADASLAIDLGRDHLAIIHTGAGDDLVATYRSVAARVAEQLRSSVTIGIGPRVTTPDAIADSYTQALAATDDRFRLGSGQVIAADSRVSPDLDYRFPTVQARHLIEEIRLGHGSTAFQICEQIVVEATTARYEDFLYSIEALVRTIRQEIGDHTDTGAVARTLIRNLAERVASIETMDDALGAFEDAVRALAQSSTSHRLRRAQAVVDRVRAFVDERIADPNLSVDLVAEHVSLSTNYLRELFRQVSSDSLSTYIVGRRLERAKQLLVTSEQPVKDVAVDSGFANYNYFFTLFKRRVGKTPSEYRRDERVHSSA